jgi:2-C-methyl-D-erythritol 4-phosphate cytidylyltransferase
MKGNITDKLLHPIMGSNAFRMCCEAFVKSEAIAFLTIVYRDEDQKKALIAEYEIVRKETDCSISPIMIKGGEERKDSVLHGLQSLPDACKFVQVHDCARPMVRPSTISMITREVEAKGAVVACRPAQDTIRQIEAKETFPNTPQSTKTLERHKLWLMETPQAARKDWLLQGFYEAAKQRISITDEIAALELISKKTAFLELGYPNPKITQIEDLDFIQYLLQK